MNRLTSLLPAGENTKSIDISQIIKAYLVILLKANTANRQSTPREQPQIPCFENYSYLYPDDDRDTDPYSISHKLCLRHSAKSPTPTILSASMWLPSTMINSLKLLASLNLHGGERELRGDKIHLCYFIWYTQE